ncbi:MAG: DUF6754 domain-containing protein [Phycisphaerae bacterium]
MRTDSALALIVAFAVLGADLPLAQAADLGDQPAATTAPVAAEQPAKNAQQSGRRFVVHATLLVLIVGGVLTGIAIARRGHALPIREIPGLTAFDEAVARATEMGRPALFTCGGVCDIRRVQLYASMPLLRRVAGLSGELGNRLIVPVAYPETLPVHANATRDGYADVGALEEYHAEDLRFFPGGQFFFAMATMGWMLTEQPAACFYFGWWEADSLMLAETGQTISALQIAGTDQLYQIPFFVAACDYTIIGEEFWAASAKMSRDPSLLGSFGAQDLFKLSLVAFIVGGILLCLHPGFAAWVESVRKTFG